MHEYAEVSFFITTKNSRPSHESLYILRINRTTVSCFSSFPETLPEDDEQLMPSISATNSVNNNVFMIHYLPIFPCFCFNISMFTVFISTLHTHDSTGFATTRSRQLKDIHSAVNAYNQRAFKVKKRSNCKCNKIHDTFKQKKQTSTKVLLIAA